MSETNESKIYNCNQNIYSLEDKVDRLKALKNKIEAFRCDMACISNYFNQVDFDQLNYYNKWNGEKCTTYKSRCRPDTYETFHQYDHAINSMYERTCDEIDYLKKQIRHLNSELLKLKNARIK